MRIHRVSSAREQRANRREQIPRRLIGRDAVDAKYSSEVGWTVIIGGPAYSINVAMGSLLETAASNVLSEGDVPKRGLNERGPG